MCVVVCVYTGKVCAHMGTSFFFRLAAWLFCLEPWLFLNCTFTVPSPHVSAPWLIQCGYCSAQSATLQETSASTGDNIRCFSPKRCTKDTIGASKYCKMFYKETNKAAIRVKGGRQVCQFGCRGQSKDDLYKIAAQAIDRLTKGSLQEARCKAFCDEKATLLG